MCFAIPSEISPAEIEFLSQIQVIFTWHKVPESLKNLANLLILTVCERMNSRKKCVSFGV